MNRRFAIIAGGGTAGHTMPALAIATALAAHDVATERIELWCSDRPVDADVLGGSGFPVVKLVGRGLRRRVTPATVASNIGALGVALFNVVRSLSSLIAHRPRIVVSVGGYVAFAPVFAALVLRIPLVTVSVDAVPSVVNRLAARGARVNFLAFADDAVPRSVVTGAPLRVGVDDRVRDPANRAQARERLAVTPGRRVLAVMSGSLGATRVNRAVAGLAIEWADRADLALIHVTGRRDVDEVRGLTTTLAGALDYRVVPFERDMITLWAAADLAVCRAGAMTVAELCAIGVPSILVPLPNSPKDHQRHNAEQLAQAGAAEVISDEDCTTERLVSSVGHLLGDEGALAAMAGSARSLGHGGAATLIAERICEEVGCG